MIERCGLSVPAHVEPNDDTHDMPGFQAYQAGELSDPEYFVQMADYLGFSIDDARRVHASMIIGPYPGVFELVQDLNADGLITGCLSNTNAPHWADLAISGRFPAVLAMKIRLASHEIDAVKPNPRAFEAFVQACGRTPGEIQLFDDSLANCLAAERLGWHALRIDSMGDPAAQMRRELVRNGLLAGVRS